MHYSFWLCDKKKKKDIFYTFYHSDAHESILVLFISSYWSIHMLFRCSLTSYPALCLLTELGGEGKGVGWCGSVGGGASLLWFVSKLFHSEKCEDVYIQKESTYQPTVWPVAIQCTSVFFVCRAFLQCWEFFLRGRIYLIGIVDRGQPVGKKKRKKKQGGDGFNISQTQSAPLHINTPLPWNVSLISCDAVIL